MSIRIYELARELNVDNNDVINVCYQIGISRQSLVQTDGKDRVKRLRAVSLISDEEADRVRNSFAEQSCRKELRFLRIRIYELARELGVDTSAVIDACRQIGISRQSRGRSDGKERAELKLTVLSPISDEEAERVRKFFAEQR